MKSGLSLVDQCLNVRLGLNLVVFRHGYDHIGNVIKVGNCLIVGMIGGDLRDQTGKFAALMTIKQIDQAVVVVRNGAPTDPPPLHAERIRHRRKMFTEVSEIDVEIFRTELDAYQERPDSASACSSACGMLPLCR